MRRREFIALLGGSATAWPFPAHAQQSGERMRRIGVLMNTDASKDQQENVATFVQALQQLGWIEGRNLQIDIRWAAGDPDEIRKHAEGLVKRSPDVILVTAMRACHRCCRRHAAFQSSFNNVADPVGAGYVETMARPGGNATGFIQFEYSLSGKWPGLLKEIAPNLTRLAVLRDAALAAGIGQFAVIQSVAPSVGMEVSAIDVQDAAEIERAVTRFASAPNGGLIVTASALAVVHLDLIMRLQPAINFLQSTTVASSSAVVV